MDVSRQASKGCGDLIFSSHLTFIINFCWMYAVMGACGQRARALRPGGVGGDLAGRGGLLGCPAPVSGSGAPTPLFNKLLVTPHAGQYYLLKIFWFLYTLATALCIIASRKQ